MNQRGPWIRFGGWPVLTYPDRKRLSAAVSESFRPTQPRHSLVNEAVLAATRSDLETIQAQPSFL
jgi:hypothetical protein